MTHILTTYGLPLLFLVVALESFGIPLPGETALIGAGVLAAEGHFSIVAVIAVAAAAAIVGDNGGYWIIGRWGGRRLFERWNWLSKFADRVLPKAERFVEKHGPKAVFFGRFITVLRYTAAWIAGIGRMDWWRFLFWNALGGIVWATLVGLIAFYFGRTVADAIARYGLYGALAAAAIAILVLGGLHLWRRRIESRV